MASRPEAAGRTPLVAWRIADGRFDPFSPTGAALLGGRWNSPGRGVIYASASYAGAMLECLAHAGIGRVPRTHVAVPVRVPASVTIERRAEHELPPGWDEADQVASRAFGDAWLAGRRSAVLMLPSVVARREFNVLINPAHPQFRRLSAGPAEPVIWDARLFGPLPAAPARS